MRGMPVIRVTATATMDQSRNVRARHDKGAEAIEESGPFGASGTYAQRAGRTAAPAEASWNTKKAESMPNATRLRVPEGRRVRGVQAEESDHRRGRRQEHRPGIVALRFDDAAFGPDLVSTGHDLLDDEDRVCDGHGHDDNRNAELTALSTKPAQPMTPMVEPMTEMSTTTRDSVRRGSAEGWRRRTRDEECGRRENFHIVVDRLRMTWFTKTSPSVIADLRMLRTDLVQEVAGIAGNLVTAAFEFSSGNAN